MSWLSQAHADALGNWHGDENGQAEGRRGWEQSTRIDLRSVANALRQLPYHVAWQRGFRQTAQILNPTIAIDIALENVRELEEGMHHNLCQPSCLLRKYPALQMDTLQSRPATFRLASTGILCKMECMPRL